MTTIENRRFALMMALGVILFLMYQAWQKDFAPVPAPVAEEMAPPEDELPQAADDVPPAGTDAPPAAAGEPAAPRADARMQRVRVETDVLRLEIALVGGDLRRAELKGYPLHKNKPDQDVALLDDRDGRWFVVQSGLAGAQAPVVSHKDAFSSRADRYVLADGQDAVEVPLEFAGADGTRVTKLYRLHRGSYVVELEHRVAAGSAPVKATPYVQLWRTPFKLGDEPPFTQTFTGVGLYQQKEGGGGYRFAKTSLEDLAEEPVAVRQTGGWIAMLQHYFMAAVLPPADQPASFAAKPSATRGSLAQYLGAAQDVPAQGQATFATRLYLGPKLQRSLGEIAPGFELTVDYGILTPLSEPLFWLLDWFFRLTGNWGAAIVLLTLAVKLALFKLSEAQYRSMAKMKKYAPRIQELKERYGDDRQRMHQAMMELYKKEKFNPLAGCWPLLIQFPVFIALYWVLLESVELRQADLALWIDDLSAPDPFYVLPVLFGVSMWVQQKLSGNVAMDPMQQRVMNMMPVMLTVFFAFFPAGLVLYWLVSNLIGIAQQWVIVRRLDREGLRH